MFNCNLESINKALKTKILILNTVDIFEQEVLDAVKTKSPSLYKRLGIGKEIDADPRRDKLEGLIRELMEGEKGKAMREMAMKWKKRAENAARAGGSSSYIYFDMLVTRLKDEPPLNKHIIMATSETIPESGPVHPSGGTVYATPYVAPAHGSVGLGERPEKFNGKDFKRWQQKMLFYLTTLNLARFLQEDAPDLGENPDRQTVAAVDAWKHSDFLCKNYILNGLDNALYNVYSPMVNAKALWESLERKYKMEDAGSKKFVVGKFLDFKMVDSKTVISQVQEFQLILHDIHAEGMVLGESFQVAALIEKLSPSWKDFKNYLKHKHKEIKLEDLIVRLRIEKDNRQSEKKAGNYHQVAKANVVEQGVKRISLKIDSSNPFKMGKTMLMLTLSKR
ncbi:hypothetical protein RJ639_033726 [Escallonia herrerae]|uniref:Uncharacterized protein n=1 Tax=Escallonia herrerae TaxID=1293975 RepID=A0AA88WVB6_9ASTE|nr:hypothetical protein RJ639_033726 [Escallonia herrerae]